jgi:glutamate-5-semialdehyde dehydrogenase
MSIAQTQRTEVPLAEIMRDLGREARAAAAILATTPTAAKNRALTEAAAAIRAQAAALADANAKDVADAQAKGISGALLDRLVLTPARIAAMADGLEAVAGLPDPVGRSMARWDRPNGLDIERVAVPLGVIGIIFESRPNVAADAGALCLKSGNAAILRGGSESFRSVKAIHAALVAGLRAAGLPETAIQMIPTTNRDAVGFLLTMDDAVDVIVPRGGKGLIERVSRESRIPVFKHLDGINHTYVHAGANADMARDVILNAKMRRTGVCGATETILIDRAALARVLPGVVEALVGAGCEVRGDAESRALDARMVPATDADWDTEYLDAIVSVRTVDGVDDALAHIAAHGSHHTDAIITDDGQAAEAFLNGVDSAIVVHNASTQFADGGEFGMGAEIGISTGRFHARGPVGLEQLTSYKYKVRGTGQTRP